MLQDLRAACIAREKGVYIRTRMRIDCLEPKFPAPNESIMRALLLSDIHANLEALQAVLAAIPSYDAVWNLGDVVGYGASPNEVVEQVRALGNVHIRGNHDKACGGLSDVADFNPMARHAVQWTRAALTPESTEWLRAMAPGPVLPIGPAVSCVHGSPLNEDQYMTDMRDAWQPLLQSRTRVTFFGHTHLQGCFAANGDGWFEPNPVFLTRDETESCELRLIRDARYLINPGSVGQPRDQDWRAACAIFDDAAHTVRFYRVPYDVRQAQQRILSAGLPEKLATRLKEGR